MDKDCKGGCPFCKCVDEAEREWRNAQWWAERLSGDTETETE